MVWVKNYYSVSHLYVGSHVDLRVTDTTIEIFSGQTRITTHKLLPAYMTNRYSAIGAHLPKKRNYSDWDAQRIRNWALRIGPACAGVVEKIFQSVKFNEQGFNASLAVLRLSKRYPSQRVEKACDIALSSGIRSPRYAHISPILETNQDKMGTGVLSIGFEQKAH